jgi:hypothetical protein
MAITDVPSKVPVKTLGQTDVQVQIADPTTPTQQAAVDTHGSLSATLRNAAGVATTSQANGSQQALDVGINVAGVQVDPRQVRALTAADVVTANQGSPNTLANAWPVEITDKTNGPVAIKPPSTAAAASDPSLVAALSPNSPLPAGSNIIGSVKLDDGAGSAITSSSINSKQRLDVNNASEGSNGSAVPFQTTQVGGSDGTNLHALKTDINGILASNVYSGGNPNSSTNPLFVTIGATIPGTPVNYYNATTSPVGVGASDSSSVYTITTGKTLSVKKVFISSSVHMRGDFQISANGTTWTTIASLFIPYGGGNAAFDYEEISVQESGTGAGVRVVFNNEDAQAATGFVSICGVEN